MVHFPTAWAVICMRPFGKKPTPTAWHVSHTRKTWSEQSSSAPDLTNYCSSSLQLDQFSSSPSSSSFLHSCLARSSSLSSFFFLFLATSGSLFGLNPLFRPWKTCL
ncbi:hypothetical protein Bca101_032548 [Brassica carinata]